MTEEKQTNDIKNLTGKYMGKILNSEGKREDGNEFKKYKLQFQVDNKTLNFNCFTPWTKKDGSVKKGVAPKDLEEGNWYNIGFSEYEGTTPDGKPYVSKTVVALFDGKEPTTSQLDKQSSPAKQDGISVPDEDTLNQIVSMYKQNVDEKVKSLNHFVGTVLMSLYENKLVKLKEVYKEKVE
jgi:hypothetical protein